MERLICGGGKHYAPKATTRDDYPTLTVQGEPSYSPDQYALYIESIGPAGGGPYTLVFELSQRRLKHAHGSYENQQAPGEVVDIKFPPG
jgi:hypothetical protein